MHSTNDCGETQNTSLRVRIEHSKQRSSKSKQAINDKEKARRKGNHTAAEVPISWALMLPIALFHFWLSVDLAEKKKKRSQIQAENNLSTLCTLLRDWLVDSFVSSGIC